MTDLIKLNLGRNCLKYIIETYGITKIFIPYYTCPVVWQAARNCGCNVKFYHINDEFLPAAEFEPNAYIIYTNYFGLCSKNCKLLSKKYKNLIIDNCQAFFSEPAGLASFSSLRKFFPVQNGAYLYIDRFIDKDYPKDDLKLEYFAAHNDFENFVKNELILNLESEIKTISTGVESIIQSINFEKIKKMRIENYKKYSEIFDKMNNIKLKLIKEDVPYCYPLNTTDTEVLSKLESTKLPFLQLWKDIPSIFKENTFLNKTIALPLDDTEICSKITKIYE